MGLLIGDNIQFQNITANCQSCHSYFIYQKKKNSSTYIRKFCAICAKQKKADNIIKNYNKVADYNGDKNPNYKGGLVNIECTVCKKTKLVIPALIKTTKYCSMKCKGVAMSIKFSGPNNPKWNGRH